VKRVALFVNHPKCSIQSINGIISALGNNKYKIFTKHEVEDNFFDDVDIVCIPGGVGDADSYDYSLIRHAPAIRKHVERGKKYIGICMGAYWADSLYLNLLPEIKIEQYIKQPSSCTHRPHAKAMEIMWRGSKEKMYFYDGCTFKGSNFDTIASYPNGMPAAIVKDNIGLIGIHPESEEVWYHYHSWMKRHWHGGSHHSLLRDFVFNLVT
jgi:glutamine amidotransferase-like uncharacterized protein